MNDESIQGRIENEFKEADFGDKRLNGRFLKLANQLESNTTAPINQACENWADTKAAYRFFNNERVTYNKIHLPHLTRTIERAAPAERIFCIQDTTSISYSSHHKTQGLCQLSGKHNFGILMHTGFLVNEKSDPIGLGYLKIWSRGETARSQGISHRFVPIEKKESFKWVDCQREMKTLLPDKEVITLGDRECDIYEFMMEASQTQMKYVIRAKSDRGVNKEKKRSAVQETLWSHMEELQKKSMIDIEVPRNSNKNEPARLAKIQVKFDGIDLHPPPNRTYNKDGNLKPIAINVVYAKEIDTPEGIEPLEWMLLTNLDVDNSEKAVEKIRFYKMRWTIEEYHKVLKSGCTIEHCRLQNAERLIRYVGLMAIIAWRLYLLKHFASTEFGVHESALRLLTENEINALHCKVHKTTSLPTEIPSLKEAMNLIARLGGHLGRKNDKHPGIIVMWRGWLRLREIVDDWIIFSPIAAKTCG